MKIFLKKHFVPIAITFFIISLAVVIRPNGQEPGDSGVKQLQILDLVSSDYKSIECKYYADIFDAKKQYIPLNDTFFVHIINNKCYYVFPFYFSYILAPIYQYLSAEAEYILPLLSGILVVWLFYFWSKELKLSSLNQNLLTINVGLGSGILHYCFILSEISLNLLLVNSSFYLLWRYNENKKVSFLFIPTLLFGLAIFFRQESLPLAFITFLSLLLTKNITMKRILFVIPVYIMLLAIWLYINNQIFQHPFGLRAIQQSQELGEGSYIMNRIKMYIEIFFYNRDNFGLFIAFPILLLIPIYWFRIKELDSKFLPFVLTAIIFSFMIPLATITYQGFNWGTRFLLSMVPILLLSAYQIYEIIIKEFPDTKIKKFLIPSLLWSSFGSLIFLIVLIYSHRQMQIGNKFVAEHTKETIVLIAKGLEGFTISSHGEKKILQALNPEQFKEILVLLKKHKIAKVSLIFPNNYYLNGKIFFTEEILNRYKILESFKIPGINIQTITLN